VNFSTRIELTPGAGFAAPQTTEIKLCGGVIHRVEVTIPDGAMDLVGVKIRNGLHQLWPTHEGTYFRGNGVTYSFRENYLLTKDINILSVDCVNCDVLYNHAPIVTFAILPAKDVAPWLQADADRLSAFLGLN
jgi:hypothetical protein